jgi:hypothetical protein
MTFKAGRASETSVSYNTTRGHNPEEYTLNPEDHYHTHKSHLILNWIISNQFTSSCPIFLTAMLISSPHLRLDLLCYLFPSSFPSNNFMQFLFSNTRHTPRVLYHSLKHCNNFLRRVWTMKLYIMDFSQCFRYFLSLSQVHIKGAAEKRAVITPTIINSNTVFTKL